MTVKGAGPGSDFYWTFDLTSYAQNWVKNFTTLAGIMIVGLPAKNEGDQSDTWRVVLAGPKFQDGVITSVVYDEPANPPTTTGGGTGGGTTTTTGGGTGFGTTTTGGGTTFGTDPGTGTGTTDPGTGGAPAPAPSTSPVTATQDIPEVQEFPAYMWLAILAGLVGFSLVRSVVIEQTTGIRPNGVLATIHRINADRTGASSTASPSGGGSGLGNGIRNLLQKLNLRKKG
jgi:hypothetical protein